MNKSNTGIYVTHGQQKLVGHRAKIDGVMSLVYMKDDKIIAFEPWDEICKQFYSGPCLEINSSKENLNHQICV